jgi:hypothetical protein
MKDPKQTAPGRETQDHEEPPETATLEELLSAPEPRREPVATGMTCVVAECVEERHPTLSGRVRVRIVDPSGHSAEAWVPTLQGLPVRAADRVLMVRPGNGEEWIVTGVIDGFAARPRVEKTAAARLELKSDESVQVVSASGVPLIEVSQGQAGAVVKLLEPDVRVELAGKLAIAAQDIQLEATRGQVKLKASDDVVVQGEIVRLN